MIKLSQLKVLTLAWGVNSENGVLSQVSSSSFDCGSKLRVIECLLTSHYITTGGLSVTGLVILNLGQVTRTIPELAPPSPNYYTNGKTLSTDVARSEWTWYQKILGNPLLASLNILRFCAYTCWGPCSLGVSLIRWQFRL
ncbi:hypothetical protein TNCV_4499371 [Trichonephila clavipes]|nr:hypothetical protein TNCV_4499371 [Trichonephila clavipes]